MAKLADHQAKEKAWVDFMATNGSSKPLDFNESMNRKKIIESLKAIEGIKRTLQEVLKTGR